jgi:hypothetical protein
MTAIDKETTLIVLRLVANGRRVVETAALAGVDLATVRSTAQEHGYPDMRRIRRSIERLENREKSAGPAHVQAVPAAGEPEADAALDRILDKAKQSRKHNTRRLASRIEVLLADLTQRIEAEAAEAKAAAARERQTEQARTDIAQLEAKLVAAKAVLRGERPGVVSTPEPTAKMIRVWAAENGVLCSSPRPRSKERPRRLRRGARRNSGMTASSLTPADIRMGRWSTPQSAPPPARCSAAQAAIWAREANPSW